MTRLTGKAELVKAGLDCIAYQITDVVKAMEQDTATHLAQLRADGGPTKNSYLMQLQSDLLEAQVLIPECEELSGIGAGYLAGITAAVYNEDIFDTMQTNAYSPAMPEQVRHKKYSGWKHAIRLTLNNR